MSPTTAPGVLPAHLRQTVPAGIGRRWAAWFVDYVLLHIVSGIMLAIVFSALLSGYSGSFVYIVIAVYLLAVFAIFFWPVRISGQTPGMRLLGVAYVRWDRPGQVLPRVLAWTLLGALTGLASFGLVPLVVFFGTLDPLRRSWYERCAGIYIIDVRAGAWPEGARRGAVRGTGSVRATGVVPQAGASQGHEAALGAWASSPAPAGEESLENTVVGGLDLAGRRPPVPPPPAASSAPADSPAPAASSVSAVPPAPEASPGFITAVPWEQGAGGQGPEATPAPPAPALPPAPPVTPSQPSASSGPVPPAPVGPVPPAPAQPPSSPLAPVPIQRGTSASDPVVVPLQVRAAQVAGPGPAPSSEEADRTVARGSGAARLLLDTGQQVMLGGTVLLGRDPVAVPPWTGAVLVPVPDYSVSKTHVALRLEGSRVLVHDLGSTNGTVVVSPGGSATVAVPGDVLEAPAGSTVRFGDRSLRVEAW